MSSSSGPVLLSDVEAAAGVSLATASRALNGQAGVGVAVAEKVRQVAHDLGYVANVHARQLAGGTTSVIGPGAAASSAQGTTETAVTTMAI